MRMGGRWFCPSCPTAATAGSHLHTTRPHTYPPDNPTPTQWDKDTTPVCPGCGMQLPARLALHAGCSEHAALLPPARTFGLVSVASQIS